MSDAERGATAPRQEAPLLKLLLEVGPLTAFFFANSRYGIFTATGVFMTATVIALAVSYVLHKRIPIMPLVSGVVVMVFGGLTLFLQDDLFIKLKPTIVNSLFAAVLLGGLFFGKSLLGYVFDSVFQLTQAGWRTLTLRWGLFFVFLAVLNEVVWRGFSTDFWVGFKLWGVMPITIVFALAQVPLIQRTSLETPEAPPANETSSASGRGAGE
jgi:intracellular septation protein